MTTASHATRVLVVDDNEIVRTGVSALLHEHDDIAVVAEAATAEDAVGAVARTQPHVVVMDVRLEGSSGIAATREIRAAHPETHVLMFSSFADDEGVYAALMAGASGYVVKRARTDQLVEAIRAVRDGRSLLDPAVTGAVLEHLRTTAREHEDDQGRLARLSAQEDRVLTRIAEGMTNREIARVMHLSDKTVKNYVSDILAKLEVSRRAEAAAYLAARRRRQQPA